ncbi:MAG TPA: hypothetical protein VJ783_13775 [Pirellulales bacterium]|nr:hypothetical protein [Pirellulales bacterium]
MTILANPAKSSVDERFERGGNIYVVQVADLTPSALLPRLQSR